MQYANALTNRGLVHEIDGEQEIAIDLHSQAIELSDRLGVPRIQAMARLNMAGPFNAMGKFDHAEQYLKECLKYDHGEFKIDARRMLAEIEIGRNHIENAVSLANEAIALVREDLGPDEIDPLEEGAALRTLGRAYYLQKDFVQAKKCLG